MAATGQGTGGDAAQGNQNANGGAEAAQQAGVDVGQLADQFGQMQTSQQELGEWLRSEPWKPQEAEPEQQQEDLDFSFLDPSDPDWNPEQIAERLGGLIESAAEKRSQQDIEPVKSELADMRREREAERLVSEFPALGEPEVAQEVVNVAKQLAEANNRPDLANEPWFWRLTYMAGTAAENANEEGSESPRAAHLEGGGGGVPAGGQVDLAQQIVNAGGGGGRNVLPF